MKKVQIYTKTFTLLILIFIGSNNIKLYGFDHILENNISTEMAISSKNGMPLWLHANNEGRWNYTKNRQWLNNINSKYSINLTNYFSTEIEAELNYLPLDNNLYLHSYSASVNLFFLQLNVGKHIFNPINNNTLSVGSYLFGNNHRPLPRITAGIPYYTKLPSKLKWIEIKGEISHGSLNDEWHGWKHKDEFIHEKYLYIRASIGDTKPYAGLNHSAIMGGYKLNGDKIPVDFINTFFAKGSEKIGGGDASNAAGAHMGLYDFGFFINKTDNNIHIYYQKPFADGSGMRIISRNRDQIIGVNWKISNNQHLKQITIEWHNTAFQSGTGMPDFIDNEGNSYTHREIRELGLDKFMDIYGQSKDAPYTEREVNAFLRNEFNNGHKYGGRDGYMSNYSYTTGWTYYGNIMGSPLNLTNQQVSHNNPSLGTYTRNLIVNDRYKAIHIGASGYFNQQWEWIFKTTLSKNYGSYFQEYPGRYTWKRTDDYFFKKGLVQSYNFAKISYTPLKIEKLTLAMELGVDYGKINKNSGFKTIISYIF